MPARLSNDRRRNEVHQSAPTPHRLKIKLTVGVGQADFVRARCSAGWALNQASTAEAAASKASASASPVPMTRSGRRTACMLWSLATPAGDLDGGGDGGVSRPRRSPPRGTAWAYRATCEARGRGRDGRRPGQGGSRLLRARYVSAKLPWRGGPSVNRVQQRRR